MRCLTPVEHRISLPLALGLGVCGWNCQGGMRRTRAPPLDVRSEVQWLFCCIWAHSVTSFLSCTQACAEVSYVQVYGVCDAMNKSSAREGLYDTTRRNAYTVVPLHSRSSVNYCVW